MRYSSFSRCRTRAEAGARKLRTAGSTALVGYGCFIPGADQSNWDERWVALATEHPYTWREEGFRHYWVEVAGTIHDVSADQFGEPPGLLVTPIGDPRYRRLGTYVPPSA